MKLTEETFDRIWTEIQHRLDYSDPIRNICVIELLPPGVPAILSIQDQGEYEPPSFVIDVVASTESLATVRDVVDSVFDEIVKQEAKLFWAEVVRNEIVDLSSMTLWMGFRIRDSFGFGTGQDQVHYWSRFHLAMVLESKPKNNLWRWAQNTSEHQASEQDRFVIEQLSQKLYRASYDPSVVMGWERPEQFVEQARLDYARQKGLKS